MGDQITPSLTYQIIIKNFLFKNKNALSGIPPKIKKQHLEFCQAFDMLLNTLQTKYIKNFAHVRDFQSSPPIKLSYFPGLLLNVLMTVMFKPSADTYVV